MSNLDVETYTKQDTVKHYFAFLSLLKKATVTVVAETSKKKNIFWPVSIFFILFTKVFNMPGYTLNIFNFNLISISILITCLWDIVWMLQEEVIC